MKLRVLKSVAVAVAASAMLAGCAVGGSGADPKGDVTLTFLTFETPNLTADYWDAAIDRANEQVPGVAIKRLVAPTADRTSYAKQLASTGQLPDLMIAVNPSGFAQSGQLAPFSEDELADYQFPLSNAIDGEQYQLPYNAQPQSLVYYNKDAFAAAGITAPPTTWDELLTASGKLKDAGIQPFEVAAGGQDTWADMYPWIGTVGADVYLDDPQFLADVNGGDASFTDENFLAATDKISQLASAGYIDEDNLARGYADSEKNFLAGNGAMYPMGSWFASAADAAKPAFEVGVFPWPTDDGRYAVPTYIGGGLSVSSEAPDVDRAKKWALAFMADKTSLDQSVKTDGSIIAMDGYEAPADTGPVYQATLAAYLQAVEDDAVTDAFTIEGGDNALPAAVVAGTAALSADLLAGRTSAADATTRLQQEFDKEQG